MARRWETEKQPATVNSAGACEILGISEATLWRWTQPGSGPFGPEKTWMIPPAVPYGAGKRSVPYWVRADVERFRDEVELRKGPRARCERGHVFDAENTYVRPDGSGRQCRECRRVRRGKPRTVEPVT